MSYSVYCRRHVASRFLDCVMVNPPDTCAVVMGIEAGGLTMTEGLCASLAKCEQKPHEKLHSCEEAMRRQQQCMIAKLTNNFLSVWHDDRFSLKSNVLANWTETFLLFSHTKSYYNF